MTTLAELRPKTKTLIIDAVSASGIDVTPWMQAKIPATNPNFCYEWAFISPAKDQAMFCLWVDDFLEDQHGIFEAGNVRQLAKKFDSEGKATKARRARSFDMILMHCRNEKSRIAVAIVDETQRRKANKIEGDSSKAAYRTLDDQPWFLESYDIMSGDYVLRRGPIQQLLGNPKLETQDVQAAAESESSDTNPDLGSATSRQAEDILAITQRQDIQATVRTALVEARIGQGKFRQDLIKLWNGQCAVTGCGELAVLRASHIKPWRDCQDEERLDPANGLLLTANLDALFDAGLVSFETDGTMILSADLPTQSRDHLGLPIAINQPLSAAQRDFLVHHRTECLKP